MNPITQYHGAMEYWSIGEIRVSGFGCQVGFQLSAKHSKFDVGGWISLRKKKLRPDKCSMFQGFRPLTTDYRTRPYHLTFLPSNLLSPYSLLTFLWLRPLTFHFFTFFNSGEAA